MSEIGSTPLLRRRGDYIIIHSTLVQITLDILRLNQPLSDALYQDPRVI